MCSARGCGEAAEPDPVVEAGESCVALRGTSSSPNTRSRWGGVIQYNSDAPRANSTTATLNRSHAAAPGERAGA